MRYEHGSSENRRRAAFLRGSLRRKLGSPDDALETAVTAQAEASMPYWRLSNVAGVHVYRVAEGWHADLAFRNLPVGVPALVGSALPWETREEALACAVRQLTLCHGREDIPLPETVAPWPLFAFDAVEIPVEPSEIPDMAERLAREGYGTDQVVGRLAYLRHAISGDAPLTLEAFQEADEEMRRKLIVACMVAMALGRTQFTPADGTWADHMPTAPGMMEKPVVLSTIAKVDVRAVADLLGISVQTAVRIYGQWTLEGQDEAADTLAWAGRVKAATFVEKPSRPAVPAPIQPVVAVEDRPAPTAPHRVHPRVARRHHRRSLREGGVTLRERVGYAPAGTRLGTNLSS